MRSLIITMLTATIFLYNNCSGSEFSTATQSVIKHGNEVKVAQPSGDNKELEDVIKTGEAIASDNDGNNLPNDNGHNLPENEINEIPDITEDQPIITEDGNAIQPNPNSDCLKGNVCLVIRDNFERSNLTGGNFAWTTLLDDLGRILNKNSNDLEVAIRNDGQASFGDKAAFFTGRKGGSVHSLYMLSKEFNLSAFNYVTIEFDYVAASFESWSFNGQSGKEHLKVDLCTAGTYECGITNDQRKSEEFLNDTAKWSNLHSLVAHTDINQNLNGTNHKTSDYTRVRGNQILINLNSTLIDKSQFMIRFNVLIDEGFTSANPDAGIIDNVIVRAYK